MWKSRQRVLIPHRCRILALMRYLILDSSASVLLSHSVAASSPLHNFSDASINVVIQQEFYALIAAQIFTLIVCSSKL